MVRLVTGGTGFIGRHLLRELAKRDGDTYVLVREASRARLERLTASLAAAHRMPPLAGHITAPGLGPPAQAQDPPPRPPLYRLTTPSPLPPPHDPSHPATL